MTSSPPSSTYAAGMLQPFLFLLDSALLVAEPTRRALRSLDVEARVDATHAHALMHAAERVLRAIPVGLRAGESGSGGDVDLLHCLLQTAATPRQLLEVAARYVRLLGDAWTLSVDVRGPRVLVWLESAPGTPITCDDFLLTLLLREPLLGGPAIRRALRVYLRHPRPIDAHDYQTALGEAQLEFATDKTGFSFDAAELDRPHAQHDRVLHRLLCQVAERTLHQLPTKRSWRERVTLQLRQQLSARAVALEEIAKQFGLHPRKLSRLIGREGTTYQEVLDEVRRTRSLELLAGGDLAISEVARLTGYTGKAPFHRAFRRWTQQTPRDFRRAARGPTQPPRTLYADLTRV